MSSTTDRIPLAEAQAVAEQFIRRIRDVCVRVEVAGSIRRQRPDVGDIEIVAIAHIEPPFPDMFGAPVLGSDVDRLHERLNSMLLTDEVRKREPVAWGPKHKRLIYAGCPVDLFVTTEAQWGVILAIRTGPADFSHALVSPPHVRLPSGQPGLLPEMYRVREGWLIYRVSGERIPTPTEEDVFAALGIPYVAPEDRR